MLEAIKKKKKKTGVLVFGAVKKKKETEEGSEGGAELVFRWEEEGIILERGENREGKRGEEVVGSGWFSKRRETPGGRSSSMLI